MIQRSGSRNGKGHGESQENGQDEKHIIDFGSVREKRLEEKRRSTERIFFKDLVNVFTVTGNSEIRPIELLDVSEDGLSFQIPHDSDEPWPTHRDDLPLRIYFSTSTYLEILVQIQNSTPSIDKNKRYLRFGCTVDKTTQSYSAYQQFVKFLKLYSEQAHRDLGDVTQFYL